VRWWVLEPTRGCNRGGRLGALTCGFWAGRRRENAFFLGFSVLAWRTREELERCESSEWGAVVA
jgi:hypothetical protein